MRCGIFCFVLPTCFRQIDRPRFQAKGISILEKSLNCLNIYFKIGNLRACGFRELPNNHKHLTPTAGRLSREKCLGTLNHALKPAPSEIVLFGHGKGVVCILDHLR
jgi:hypothetical protein